MPLIISPPSTIFDGNITQKVLGATQPKTTPLIANTAADILDADETATNGRKLLCLSNTGTETAYISYGTTATLNDYDFPLYGNRQILDIEYNGERISAIAAAPTTIRVKFAKYNEV